MEEEVVVKLREEESRLVRLIQAIESLEGSKEWTVMKELLFDDLVEKIKGRILQEALSASPNLAKLENMKGELAWSRKYADFNEFGRSLKVELESIRKRI